METGKMATQRAKGRPQAQEPYQKVTVCLFDRQVLFLDEVALEIRKRTRQSVRRAEIVRILVDEAAGSVNPKQKDLHRTVQLVLSRLESE